MAGTLPVSRLAPVANGPQSPIFTGDSSPAGDSAGNGTQDFIKLFVMVLSAGCQPPDKAAAGGSIAPIQTR